MCFSKLNTKVPRVIFSTDNLVFEVFISSKGLIIVGLCIMLPSHKNILLIFSITIHDKFKKKTSSVQNLTVLLPSLTHHHVCNHLIQILYFVSNFLNCM